MLMTQAVLEHPQASHMRERATEKRSADGRRTWGWPQSNCSATFRHLLLGRQYIRSISAHLDLNSKCTLIRRIRYLGNRIVNWTRAHFCYALAMLYLGIELQSPDLALVANVLLRTQTFGCH